jgi:hypothetical protein
VSKRLGSRYRSGRSQDWLEFRNPAAPVVKNAELVRTVLAIPPKTTEPGKIRIGDFIAPAILRPVPAGLADRIPSLRGLQYAVDVNYAIALADPAGKVVAII